MDGVWGVVGVYGLDAVYGVVVVGVDIWGGVGNVDGVVRYGCREWCGWCELCGGCGWVRWCG